MGSRTLTRRSDDRPLKHSRFIDNPLVHKLLLVLAIFAVALTISDGILTPAVSIVSAVGGISIAVPSLDVGAIQGISIAIVVVLFAIQPYGTHRVGLSFAPIVSVWLSLLAGTGI